MIGKRWSVRGGAALAALILVSAAGAQAEYNPVSTRPVSIGPEAGRLIVGFRATSSNTVVQTIHSQARGTTVNISQARTDAGDLAALTQRAGLNVAKSRQLTSSMHVIHLQKTLYGADVAAALTALRADPAVKFAEVDQRRYPHATTPNDLLFGPSANATGQWFMLAPSTLTPTSDAAATDAVSAWDITKGSTGTVIADVDTGVLFDHPDLLRTGFGGRLLPGYDFVSGDVNPSSPYNSLGTFLIANDGDGWDPDPSDPGDWISATDEKNVLFPAATCGGPNGAPSDSSWHGTRVMGILGALTDNTVGVAGMTWYPYLLPVRALGKCGGYDSDIITGMQWAAGMPITGVPNNPYPADIINLSLGGPGSCPTAYADVVTALNTLGVLIVASAGNESGPVDAPANCTGVLGVAGLRNVGTKVGYSSLGPQVGIAAPAGNCVNSSGACLKSIDTTTSTGLTTPAASTYTDQSSPNLGTSFSAPIVSGIAALMRAVNANLTPAQLIARIESSATAFPQPAPLIASGYVCPTADPASGECACPINHSQCGYGMANALAAVKAAQRPIAAVVVPASSAVGSAAVLDASGSAASCGRTIASYAWTANPSSLIPPGSTAAQVTVTPNGTAGTVTLVVTDNLGDTDTATLAVAAGGAITKAAVVAASAGTSAGACPTPLTVTTSAPTVTEAFSPASVGENVVSTLTITLSNLNAFALTQASLTEALPANLSVSTSASAAAPATTCGGGTLTNTTSSVTLSGADIPAKGSCAITLPVQSATAGSYTSTVAAKALTTGPAGANAQSATAVLSVTAPPSKGGGGDLDWWDTMFVVGVLLAGRRHAKRRPQRQ
ncbi:MAG TPA: S8 family peptidase [Steroidobacteraceae bacterium]|nr:S8 family peptidase [Steroidobacteraceae bacterium]